MTADTQRSLHASPTPSIPAHPKLCSYLLNTPHQLPQITTLHPLLLPSTTHTQSASRPTTTNTPALADFANDTCRLPSYYRSRRNDHVCGNDAVGQDLDVLFDDGEGMDSDIRANVNV